MKYVFEGCCTGAADAVTAQRSGAARVELCSRLDIGGVTPPEDLIRETLLALAEDSYRSGGMNAKVNVLVRPRGGDFVFTEEEIIAMVDGIRMCKELSVKDSKGVEHRVNGVVVGALRTDGSVDMAAMRRLVAAARPLEVTFHRAFDECSGIERSLEDVISLGCDRLLTSGHAPDAFAGRFTLARLVRQAAGRIVILAGCGVRPHNIDAIAETVLSSVPDASAITDAVLASIPDAASSAISNNTSVLSSSCSPFLEFHSSTLTGW